MHGIAKRGLALVAATSGLIFGSAAFAAADSATTAETSHSGGIVAGQVVQVPANIPVKLCGENLQAGAVRERLRGTVCTTGAGVADTASSDRSGGIGSGNIVQGALNTPVLFCGWNVNAASFGDRHGGSYCAADQNGPGASATAAATDSGGILSGNILQFGVNAPIDLCGNNVTLGTVDDSYQGSACTD